ncbi:MAG: RNA ligase (ATP) [Promethearchaeota archaeon]
MSKLIVEACKIEKVENHPNADRLDIVTVKGWNCIVGRDNYKVGDVVIYCPPDSVIPDDIIEKYNLEYLKKNGRVGTVKLRGYISQGLILDIPKEFSRYAKVGMDFAKMLKITKYEPPTPSFQQSTGKITKKKKNPLFDRYTEIENIKNYNGVFQDCDDVVITEKIHGTNFRAGILDISPGKGIIGKLKFLFQKYILKQSKEFVYGSHNVQLGAFSRRTFYKKNVYAEIAKRYDLVNKLNTTGAQNIIIYGEIYGAGIQKGYEYGLEDIDVVFFDVKINGRYMSFDEFELFCKSRNLPIVPVLYEGDYSEEIRQKYSKGKSILCPKQKIREGCVIKSLFEENNPRVGRKILKSVNDDYLLIKDRTDYK